VASFTPPELRWTRRVAMERGMASIAALCLLPAAATKTVAVSSRPRSSR
jgi:hypothetical protein